MGGPARRAPPTSLKEPARLRHHAMCCTPAVNNKPHERLLKAIFGDARASSLADLIEGSLMIKFNKAKRKAEKEMLTQSAGPN